MRRCRGIKTEQAACEGCGTSGTLSDQGQVPPNPASAVSQLQGHLESLLPHWLGHGPPRGSETSGQPATLHQPAASSLVTAGQQWPA